MLHFNLRHLTRNVTWTYYPYRTAMPTKAILEIERHSEHGKRLEKQLLEAVGKDRDNHTVIGAEQEDGSTVYFGISDFTIMVGLGVRVRDW